MKMVAEYLEKAHAFERMAASETNPELKTSLLDQAKAYQKLAGERAKNQGLPFPPPQSNSD
jgi:hypothetical protein